MNKVGLGWEIENKAHNGRIDLHIINYWFTADSVGSISSKFVRINNFMRGLT